MEDEDGEARNMNPWKKIKIGHNDNIGINETLMQANGTEEYSSDITEEREECSYYQQPKSKESSLSPQIPFKGFKKRILAQTQENQSFNKDLPSQINASGKTLKDKRPELKRGKITEYAQYLGLQPSTKCPCPNRKKTNRNFPMSMTKQNCGCSMDTTSSLSTSSTPEMSSSSLPPAPNFNRKVYLCSACSTYFENWNLFLHMREVHERHICLFCLGLFDQVERLSHHLSKNHSIPETFFSSVDDFYRIFKGSCYLICCSCEKVFSESDNFYNHFCPTSIQKSQPQKVSNICSVCKQIDSHLRTCSLAPETESEMVQMPFSKELSTKFVRHNKVKGLKLQRPWNALDTTVKKNVKVFSKQLVHNTQNKELKSKPLPWAEKSRLQNPNIRDTVAETIMEVSRCLSDSNSIESNITEETKKEGTLQQVSRDDKVINSINDVVIDASREERESVDAMHTSKTESEENESEDVSNDKSQIENKKIVYAEDVEPSSDHKTNNDVRLSQVDELEERSNKERERNSLDSVESVNGTKSPVFSNSNSPTTSRSLFSPPRAEPVVSVQEDESENTNMKRSVQQAAVSFNAIPSSDRSLVIKICANKNSTFSISTPNKPDTQQITNRESEENNNGQASTSEETHWNHCDDKDSEQEDSFQGNKYDSDSDSEKLAMADSNVEEGEESESDRINDGKVNNDVSMQEDENDEEEEVMNKEKQENDTNVQNTETKESDELIQEISEIKSMEGGNIVLAGADIPCLDLNVEGILETMDIQDLLKRCINVSSAVCVYCNHARLIAVNGKQLGLHMLTEHRFQPQHPAIIINMEQFVAKVKKSLPELESLYFNLDTYDSQKGTYNISNTRVYECFHCRFCSTVHKELYLHNRKMHQKTIILCVMCKSTFHSYSELLCHLCPGIYAANTNIKYRCCLCPVSNLPSSFRLMVHLRKVHHACDVCLEATGNQQRLSNHVWKHKLNHLCYRCGISYRNKPDITKHLFWKHGTESVLCKKCLQKKWPHVYHFCIPPTAFVCEECGLSLSKAVALKVHKRLHSNDLPYPCSECPEKFVSRKLLQKHEECHKAPASPDVDVMNVGNQPINGHSISALDKEDKLTNDNTDPVDVAKDSKEPVKKVVDVYDLPPLNLSSDSDSDSDQEKVERKDNAEETQKTESGPKTSVAESTGSPEVRIDPSDITNIMEVEQDEEEKKQEARIMNGIWDNFKSYAASLESETLKLSGLDPNLEFLKSVILADHDYCVVSSEKDKSTQQLENEESLLKTDTANIKLPNSQKNEETVSTTLESVDNTKKKLKSPKKKKQQQQSGSSSSDSSSDSDSSSCSCGTNCSCSSSSSNSSSSSSSSSDSDSSTSESSPKKQQSPRKERKKEKNSSSKRANRITEAEMKETVTEQGTPATPATEVTESSPVKAAPRESDLDTDETVTDEDFYDEHPQLLASKIMAEKRNQQLMILASVAAAPTTASLNNGAVDTHDVTPFPELLATDNDKVSYTKKRVKNKKRKKMYKTKPKNMTKPVVEAIKLNIPKSFYQRKSSSLKSSHISVVSNRTSTVNNTEVTLNETTRLQPMKLMTQNSGSENENKRSSKRKRVPKRFYGDSSDEENEKQTRWRKVETSNFVIKAQPCPPRPTIIQQQEESSVVQSASESDEPSDSSSDSESEVENSRPNIHLPQPHAPNQARADNVYCYCQCPYDEVSEMIACDAQDCRIEWFHFECVGIMVPPKGKWYCPDCRERLGLPQASEETYD